MHRLDFQVEMNDNVEIIRSNKGGMKLIHRGYMYTVHKKRQSGGIRWRCTQRSLHCKGSISTGNGPPKVNMPHNHIPDPHSVALARCRQFEEFADLTPLVEAECEELEDTILPKRTTDHNATNLQRTPDSSTSTQSGSHTTPKIKQAVTPQGTTSKPPDTPDSDMDEVCLRWNSHHSNMKNMFPTLLQREQYVDATLAAEGKMLKCHRLVLSSCSAYFDEMISGISVHQHPVIFINGVEFWILKALIDFMYAGEVHIEQHKLPHLLKVAEMLQIKGLAGKSAQPEVKNEIQAATPPVKSEPVHTPEQKPSPKKENISHKPPSLKSIKPFPATLISASDPLALLQPTFFEENPDPPFKSKESPSSAKKVIPKKIRKRKMSDHEPSPPPVLFRKGTKSRPHVKVPRQYLGDYENVSDMKPPKLEEPTVEDTLYDINNVKSEPIDIEDVDLNFGESYRDCDEKSDRSEQNISAEKQGSECRKQKLKSNNVNENRIPSGCDDDFIKGSNRNHTSEDDVPEKKSDLDQIGNKNVDAEEESSSKDDLKIGI